MPKLRRLSGDEVIRILERFGFAVYTQKGSHVKLRVSVREVKSKHSLSRVIANLIQEPCRQSFGKQVVTFGWTNCVPIFT